ncbi:hypothetical protein O4U47_31115, partial [Nocardiopsis sp. LSu2-4]|nr:hypothetical protein [Nocardiopsis suaedae]
NQGVLDLDVPVNASGNAVGAIGGVAAAASKDTGAFVDETDGGMNGGGNGDNGDNGDGGDNGYRLSQLAPGTGGLVDTLSTAAQPAHLQGGGVDAGPVLHQSHGQVEDIVTSGNGSVVGGNQIVGDADVPVNVSGNAVAGVLSSAAATSEDTGAFIWDEDDRGIVTSGNGSVLGGNQGVVDADVPVNVSGNAVSGIASTAAAASEDTGAWVDHGETEMVRTSDASSARQEAGDSGALPAPLDTLPLSNELPAAPAAPELPGSEALPLSNELPEPVDLPATDSLPLSAEQLPEAPVEAPAAEAPEAPAELSGLPSGGEAKDPVSSVTDGVAGGVTEGLGLGL